YRQNCYGSTAIGAVGGAIEVGNGRQSVDTVKAGTQFALEVALGQLQPDDAPVRQLAPCAVHAQIPGHNREVAAGQAKYRRTLSDAQPVEGTPALGVEIVLR